MNAESLKNSILQLAIQGKLVEQREEEGTAEELYNEIQLEKEKLIEEGKIRKQKKLPEITEEEIPFDIPETWKWKRLNEITYNWGQKRPEEIFHYIDVASIDNEKGLLSNELNLIEPKNAPSRARKIVKKGSVLFSTVRPYLMNICVVDKLFEYESIVSTAFSVLHPFKGIESKYLFYVLRSPMFIYYVNGKSTGATYPAINDKNLQRGIIPIPPLAEQKRIVEKIKELIPLVERYGKAYEEVTELNKNFPTEMEKSILQYAIQGKLVEQREEEGTAEELYKQIQLEKEKLIEEGKIRKQKKLPEITEEEIPFEIPKAWKWVRLGDVYTVLMGQSPKGKNVSEEIQGIEFHQGKKLFGEKYLLKSSQYTDLPTRVVEPNTLIMSVRAPVGDVNITEREICIGRGLCGVQIINNNTKIDFLYYLLTAIKFEFIKKSTGSTFSAITAKVVHNQVIPLPPLAEQKRIVARIEELLEYTRKLKEE